MEILYMISVMAQLLSRRITRTKDKQEVCCIIHRSYIPSSQKNQPQFLRQEGGRGTCLSDAKIASEILDFCRSQVGKHTVCASLLYCLHADDYTVVIYASKSR